MLNMESIFRTAQTLNLNGIPVKFDEIDDNGDPAIAHQVATDLAKRKDTLMVVGHVLSSTTKEALPIYIGASPQIPVILTTETNPEILPKSDDPDQEFPVFRLSPTDDDQAASAYEFAKQHDAKKFWVVEDPNNSVYTKYLANRFLEDAQRSSTSVLSLTSLMNPLPSQTVERLGVQWVFFAGGWHGALMLIRELKAANLSQLKFILSDGCASPELLQNGGADVNGVYVMHPLKAEEFSKKGYGIYASDALEIIDRLIKKADQRFSEIAQREVGLPYRLHQALRIHRVSDARQVVSECMIRSMASPFRLSTGEVFRFRKNATREDATFNVWTIRDGRFEDGTTAPVPEARKAVARLRSSGLYAQAAMPPRQ
jgi:branched-chain amino acid transport system substrate-binding protein